MIEKPQKDGIDRGEIRTVFSATHDAIRATGKTMCKEHKWKKLSENEVYCINCPSALIVNPEAVESMIQ